MPAKDKRSVFETGTEPEFFVNHIDRWEDAGNGMVRVYFSSVRGRGERLEYTKVTSAAELAEMGRAFLRIAAEFHNMLTTHPEGEVAH